MTPALEPGDRLVVIRARRLRPGDLVAFVDPELPTRVLVKRLRSRLVGAIDVVGDNAAASRDSRTFGTVPDRLVLGRAIYRYHPAERTGWVGRRPSSRR